MNTESHYVPTVPLIIVADRRPRAWPKRAIAIAVIVPMVIMAVKLVRNIHGDYMVATGKLEARQTSPSATGEPLPVRARTLTASTPAAEPAESPVANKTVSPVPTRESQVAVGGTGDEVFHVVRSGDTLSTLAKSYSTSVRAIKWANGLSSERLTVGTRLRMPASGPSSAAAL